MKTREIKFRAWDEDRNQMIYQFGLLSENRTALLQNDEGYIFSGNSMQNGDWQEPTLMQFTGLKDRNGKDAYYGDIIEHSTTEGGIFRRVISWSDELQCTMIDNLPYYRLHESGYIQPSKLVFDIIGNIFENPELKP